MKKIIVFFILSLSISALTCTNCDGLSAHATQKGLDKNITVSSNASIRNAAFTEPVLLVAYAFLIDGRDETSNPAYAFANKNGLASWSVPFIAANSSHTFSLVYSKPQNKIKNTQTPQPQPLPPTQADLSLLFPLALIPLFFLAWRAFDNRVTVKRKRDEDRVEIIVENRRAPLRFLELTDLLPENAGPKHFSEKPEAIETVSGLLLKWRKDSLGRGCTWRVSYLFDGDGHARLSAVASSGEEVRVTSGQPA